MLENYYYYCCYCYYYYYLLILLLLLFYLPRIASLVLIALLTEFVVVFY